ncbi:MAG: hypothetical protein R2681_13535 [Pyrinomonadaceae bacterium]
MKRSLTFTGIFEVAFAVARSSETDAPNSNTDSSISWVVVNANSFAAKKMPGNLRDQRQLR